MPRKKRKADPPWTPFKECNLQRYLDDQREKVGLSGKKLENVVGIYRNSRYQVEVSEAGEGAMRLSIKRIDKRAVHSWRDFQRIKNELLGPEIEAIELYPAESRLVDTANQYWLWGFPPGTKLPLGFDERLVSTPDTPEGHNKDGSRQEPFEETPPDAVPASELVDKYLAEHKE